MPSHGFSLMAFDVDGTLRETTVEGQFCPNRPDQWEIRAGVLETFDRLYSQGELWTVSLGMVTNQGGVAYGFLSQRVAAGMLTDLAAELKPFSRIDWHIKMCPHHPEGELGRYAFACACRKPQPGLLFELMIETMSGPKHTLFVGDLESDKETAKAAGCHFMWADDFFALGQDGIRTDLITSWDDDDMNWMAYPDWCEKLANGGDRLKRLVGGITRDLTGELAK